MIERWATHYVQHVVHFLVLDADLQVLRVIHDGCEEISLPSVDFEQFRPFQSCHYQTAYCFLHLHALRVLLKLL